MYKTVVDVSGANSHTQILDVGVTSNNREESNFLEKMHPHPQNIVAVGVENFYGIVQECRGIKYVKADGINLPFRDRTFDLVTSFAVLEHVGSNANQKKFIHELCRVGKSCIIATPNRWYPIEFHTLMPILHWLPPGLFRKILHFSGKSFYAQEENLNLLDSKTLLRMFPKDMIVEKHHHHLLGIISNLFFYARRP